MAHREVNGGSPGGEQAEDPVRLTSVPIIRALVGTYSVSAVGSAMVGVGVAFVAYQRSRSIVLTVVVLAANALPALALMPIAARLSLGRDPRTVEITEQVAKAVLSLGVAVIAAGGGLSYGVLLVSNFLNGSISALIAPAWPRLAQAIAPEGRLADLTALFGGVAAGASIVGALLGGVMVTTLGIAWVFVANAASYLPMSIAVRRVTVFDELEIAPDDVRHRPIHGYHWVVGLLAPEVLHHSLAHVYHPVE